jgi:hypothetical protein
VIAPGQGRDKKNAAFEALREAVEPHARQGTSEDLAEESQVFTGAARTLDGAPVYALSERSDALGHLFVPISLCFWDDIGRELTQKPTCYMQTVLGCCA